MECTVDTSVPRHDRECVLAILSVVGGAGHATPSCVLCDQYERLPTGERRFLDQI